jgi:phosphoribosylformylglycinamidine cyclo-ligase
MCVDDIVPLGARPLFMLDYVGCHTLIPEQIAAIVSGVAKGCELAGCALVGGETAELSELYHEGEYDLAGFAVGVVERSRIIDGSRTEAGDVVIGLASSGLHSNGYTLARKVLLEHAGLKLEQHIEELGRTLGEELLEPTRIYARSLVRLCGQVEVHGIAHITGGGIPRNVGRITRPGLSARLDRASWPKPAVFDLIQRHGDVEDAEMYRTFNMGLGMVLAVPEALADEAVDVLAEAGERAFAIGHVEEGEERVVLT